MNQYKFLVIFFFFLLSCSIKSRITERHLDLMLGDYSHYQGLSLFIKNYDIANNAIVYLHDYSNGFNICGYKYFNTKVECASILKCGIRLFSDTCHLEISSIDSLLVKDFSEMRVRRLMVDNLGNIFISLKYLDDFDIIKLVNYTDSTHKYKSWIQMGKNWYLKPS